MARSFNGTTDGISTSLATPTNFTNAQTFSVAAWVNLAANSGDEAIVGNVDAIPGTTFRGWELALENSTGGPRVLLFNDNSSTSRIIKRFLTTMTTGTYTHLGFTYAGTSLASGVNNYTNGLLDNGTVVTDNLLGTIASGIAPQIGKRTDGSKVWNGRLADLAVWNVVLNTSEMTALFRGERPPRIRPAALVSYWPLDGIASPEPDLSGNANNGTLTGTALAFGPPVRPLTRRWVSPSLVLPVAGLDWIIQRRNKLRSEGEG